MNELAALGRKLWDGHFQQRDRKLARWVLYQAQNGRCARCGLPMDKDKRGTPRGASLDHVTPLGKGGFDLPGNWLMMHQRCNNLKGGSKPSVTELAVLDRVNAMLGWRRVVKFEDFYGPRAEPVSALCAP